MEKSVQGFAQRLRVNDMELSLDIGFPGSMSGIPLHCLGYGLLLAEFVFFLGDRD